MSEPLRSYVERFNRSDEELYINDIPNSEAYGWLRERIPLFECPDKQLETTYYFRWWTYRKHIKTTPDGIAISEFLPNVPWAKKYNIINAPAGHHLLEGRWLRGSKDIFASYLRFYLNDSEASHNYSAPLLYSAMEYERTAGSLGINDSDLSKMIEYYHEWERDHGHPSGLFWSIDDRDAMEYSISGHRNGKAVKGLRPTLNSYMYGEALAIAYFADRLGNRAVRDEYTAKAQRLKGLINDKLLKGGFYKALHGECDEELFALAEREDDTGSPMELIGYIPFAFGIPEDGAERAFLYLDDERVFSAKTGLSTVDMRHPDFLKKYDHECLWNGYVWPFATSQTLFSLYKTVKRGHSELKPLLAKEIVRYSRMHVIERDGVTLPWIDEVMSPNEYVWTSREILRKWGWKERAGGYERGKDYNHSTFCDLVISGIVGVNTDREVLTVDPAIPEGWDYFKLEGVEYRGRLYTVIYDKTGEKYGKGKGVTVSSES